MRAFIRWLRRIVLGIPRSEAEDEIVPTARIQEVVGGTGRVRVAGRGRDGGLRPAGNGRLGATESRVTVKRPGDAPRPQSHGSDGGGAVGSAATVVRSRRDHVEVRADRRPYWVIRGWRRLDRKLVGAYRMEGHAYAGEIELDGTGRARFFIINPPQAVLRGPHGACFRKRGDRYWVHFNRGYSVDGGIVAVEQVIREALKG